MRRDVAVVRGGPMGSSVACTGSGLHEKCELDGNPIIGNGPGELGNFRVVSGFSGHGMMHAPAAGRAVAERVATGASRTPDLGRLGYERVVRGEPYPGVGVLPGPGEAGSA